MENVSSTFESRYAHLVFAKKLSMKSALAASDSAYFELTKAIAKVGLFDMNARYFLTCDAR